MTRAPDPRTHCFSPRALTASGTVCSAPSLPWTAATATKSSVSGILFFKKSKHKREKRRQGLVTPCRLFRFPARKHNLCFPWSVFLFLPLPALLLAVHFSLGSADANRTFAVASNFR